MKMVVCKGLLGISWCAYVGCDVLSSAIGMDKDMARRVACIDGLNQHVISYYPGILLLLKDNIFVNEVAAEFGWPLFVKPCSLGSSVGIHKAKNMAELIAAVDDALRYDEEILVE